MKTINLYQNTYQQDGYIGVTEKEAFMLLSHGTPVTICDVYSTREEMFGEEVVREMIPMFTTKFIDWKKGGECSYYDASIGTDVNVVTYYYVHIDDVSFQ